MKKITAVFALFFVINFLSAQYLIVGSDSISLADFKKDYDYGLKTNGVQKTITTTEEFLLMQQFAKSKRADTTSTFMDRLYQKESELRKEFFFPKSVKDPVLQDYVNSNAVERQVQIFIVQKEAGDTKDYQKIYNDVKSGALTMENAIKENSKSSSDPIYIKAGTIDNDLYSEIKTLPVNSYTKLINNANFAAFAKVLGSRPSLGYMVFGVISYPNDDKAKDVKLQIDNDLKAGKKFEEVAKNNGSTDHEKNNGGLVMGSPTLPNEVYAALKGQNPGFTSQPILMNDKYFIFHIYQIFPYKLNEDTGELFFKEMQNSVYNTVLYDRLLQYIKSQPGFKEFPVAQTLKKSYQTLDQYKNDADVVYQYNGIKSKVSDLKKMIEEHKDQASKMTDKEWTEAFSDLEDQNLLQAYSQDFSNIPQIKEELKLTSRMLLSDYIFSKYLKDEITSHPEWLTEYYNANKSKFLWDKRAKGRVAIVADESLVKEIKKEIADPKKWEALKEKYKGKLNGKNQILVHFEEGEMMENADVFTKYKVPFSKGVHSVKMEQRDLVLGIDEILEPSQMSFEEAKDMVEEAVTSDLIRKITAEQRAKTKIIVQPEFLKDLEKNFKK